MQIARVLPLTLFFLTLTGTAFAGNVVSIQLTNNSQYTLQANVVAQQFNRSFSLTDIPMNQSRLLTLTLPYFDSGGGYCYALASPGAPTSGNEYILCSDIQATVTISADSAGGYKKIASFIFNPQTSAATHIFSYCPSSSSSKTGYLLQDYTITPTIIANGAAINVTQTTPSPEYNYNVSISYDPTTP